jgi:purine nucleoside phosphorylase
MRVLGLFSVTNMAGEAATHEEVLATADRAAGEMRRLLPELLPRLGADGKERR